jgi:hypothetical protein
MKLAREGEEKFPISTACPPNFGCVGGTRKKFFRISSRKFSSAAPTNDFHIMFNGT